MHNYEWEVDLRFGELLRFQLYMVLIRMKLGVLVAIWLLLAAYMVAQVLTGQVSPSESTKGLLITLGLPSFILAVTALGTYRSFHQVWKPKLPIQYSIGPAGISTSMPSVASQIQWSGIGEAKSWGGLLLLFLNRHCALIIPTRCLGEQAPEIRQFIAESLRRAV